MLFRKKIKLVYDISVLGAGTVDQKARTGVFRVIENLMWGLKEKSEIKLSLFALPDFISSTEEYLKHNPSLNLSWDLFLSANNSKSKFWNRGNRNCSFTDEEKNSALKIRYNLKKIKKSAIFHSTFFQIPDEISQLPKINKFITVYDLLPVKFPHLFTEEHISHYKATLQSITDDTYIFCISNSTKNDLCEYLNHINPEHVFVTHLAASSLFYPVRDQSIIQTVKEKYNIPDRPYILSLSTLEPRKNIELTINAFADIVLQERINDLYLILVGTKGWKFDAIFEKIKEYPEVEKRVIFTGYVADEDLAALYSGSTMFVYPSLYEGFGLPPLEAMQCGVPVITSDNSSLPEVVGNAGIMIDSKDKNSLCQAIIKIYKNEPFQNSMSTESVEQANKFSWNSCVNQTIDAYRNSR
jgi:glycosyltransferase involved in cell wall biosynthesis